MLLFKPLDIGLQWRLFPVSPCVYCPNNYAGGVSLLRGRDLRNLSHLSGTYVPDKISNHSSANA